MTTHRERALGQARADLTALPDLTAELARLIADRHHDITGYRGKVIGSPAPLQLPVVHLVDNGRHKPAWHGEDPRYSRWSLTWFDRYDREDRKGDEKTAHMRVFPTEGAARDALDRLDPGLQDGARVTAWRARDVYGAAALLETWVRVLTEELPEYPDLTEQATVRSEAAVLVEHWAFITEQQWAEELAQDVSTMTRQVKAALGIRPEYRPRCRKCQSNVIPVDADRRLTSWEACAYGACTGCDWTYPKGPALDALAHVQPGMVLTEIAAIIGVPVKTLHRWKDEGLIKPCEEPGRRRNRTYDLAAVTDVATRLRRVS